MARSRRPATEKSVARKPGDPTEISPIRLALFTYGLPVVLLAGVLIYAIRLFTITAPEAVSLNASAQPFAVILSHLRGGLSPAQTPVLYALLMHVYLFLSGGAISWLRLPDALFYVAGLYFLARAASRWGGGASAAMLLLVAALWPYGFHYGALADVYSFAFLLSGALLFCYVRYGEAPTPKLWIAINLLAVALVYTTYLGWAVLVFLGIGDWLRSRNQDRSAGLRIAISSAIVAGLYTPLWPAFARDLSLAVRMHPSLRAVAMDAAYNLYVLLASESIAPWFWRYAAPAAVAIVIGLALLLVRLRGIAREFLLFGLGLLLLMAFAGSLETWRLLLVAPWILLPIALALSTWESAPLRRTLLICMVVVAGIGWFGAYARLYYARADFSEPWLGLAAGTAGAMHEGAGLISNSDPFFLYLTYALGEPAPEPGVPWRYVGSLPRTIGDAHIWSAQQWIAAGQPIQPYMIWMRGVGSPAEDQAMDSVSKVLDDHCGGRLTRYLVREPAFGAGSHFMPQPIRSPWRIEVHQYECPGFPGAATPAQKPPTAAPAPAPTKSGK